MSEWNRVRADWRIREYRLRRKALILEMGGQCIYCIEKGMFTHTNLEFHHPPPGRTWNPTKMDCLTRLRQYRQDFRAGKLVLACRECNAKRNSRQQGLTEKEQSILDSHLEKEYKRKT